MSAVKRPKASSVCAPRVTIARRSSAPPTTTTSSAGPAPERVGHRRAVRDERAGVLGRDRLDQLERGAAAVDDRDHVGLEQRRRCAGGRDLALDGLDRARLVGARDGRAGERAAVHALEPARLRELVQVAPDRVARDAEDVLQLGRHDAPVTLDEIEDLALALLLQHALLPLCPFPSRGIWAYHRKNVQLCNPGIVGRETELEAVGGFVEDGDRRALARAHRRPGDRQDDAVGGRRRGRARARGARARRARERRRGEAVVRRADRPLRLRRRARRFDALPAPQRAALEVALLRAEPRRRAAEPARDRARLPEPAARAGRRRPGGGRDRRHPVAGRAVGRRARVRRPPAGRRARRVPARAPPRARDSRLESALERHELRAPRGRPARASTPRAGCWPSGSA